MSDGHFASRGIGALNGICPYFTMFPLDFPYSILSGHASTGDWILDPFCGRGTTNYAGRLLGMPSVGIDSNPVAVALAQAKLANSTPQEVIAVAQRILEEVTTPSAMPEGEFWDWAYHRSVLLAICRLREALLRDCQSDDRKALRALLMGSLHGPRPKSRPAYLSNQSPRTYAPKPRYAVRYWKERSLHPEPVDVLPIIVERAYRYYGGESTKSIGVAVLGDSREPITYSELPPGQRFRWVITSPPYYGMRTYVSDQWLRSWFIGGPSTVDYSSQGQLEHSSPSVFASQLRGVWQNVGRVCLPGASMVVRFGAINDRRIDAPSLLMDSLTDSGWQIACIEPAGSASRGRRQALHFSGRTTRALEEHDLWAVRTG